MQHDLGASNNSPVNGDDNPSSPAQAGRKRKATSGSRGVATLTPDQLAKKRANDREAQRAIRERTKQQIETLERRIQDLTAQQPYQELQNAIRQKDAIQAENDEIRRRLASIMSILQPIVGAQGLTDLATAAQSNVHAGLQPQNHAFANNGTNHPDQYLNGQQPQAYPHPYSPAEVTENRQWTGQRDALTLQRDNLQRGLELNDAGERVSFTFLLDNLGQRPGEAHPQNTQSSPLHQSKYPHPNEPSSQPWTQLPKNVDATCPLDTLLLNFRDSRRQEAGTGSSTAIFNPAYPSVSSLLNPSGSGIRFPDPLSQLMADIISKFPNICNLPEQTAVLYTMFINMRWHINPTQENFERLVDWMRPTPAQIYNEHPAWIDHIPWPRMRDKLVANHADYSFENWFIPFTTDISVNWPYEDSDCLISTSEKDETVINPAFERHFRRLENWSVGPSFAEAFPDLIETTTVKAPMRHNSSSAAPSSAGGGGGGGSGGGGVGGGPGSTVATSRNKLSSAQGANDF